MLVPLKFLARIGNVSVNEVEVLKFYSYDTAFIVMLFDTWNDGKMSYIFYRQCKCKGVMSTNSISYIDWRYLSKHAKV